MGNFARGEGEFFYQVVGMGGIFFDQGRGVILTIQTFFKAKNKIKISMAMYVQSLNKNGKRAITTVKNEVLVLVRYNMKIVI